MKKIADWATLQEKLKSLTSPYVGVIEGVANCNIIPDSPIAGSGVSTISMEAKNGELKYFLTRTDFWLSNFLGEKSNYPHFVLKPSALGTIRIKSNFDVKNAVHTQDMSEATIGTKTEKFAVKVTPIAQDDLVLINIKATQDAEFSLELTAYRAEDNPYVVAKEGEKNGALWFSREQCSLIVNNGCCVAKVLDKEVTTFEDDKLKPMQKISLKANEECNIVVTLKGGKDEYQHFEKAFDCVDNFTLADFNKKLACNQTWWKNFWTKSAIYTDDIDLLKYYYGAIYVLACCSEIEGRTPPGIAGGWMHEIDPIWGGHYTMNYNGESPFWGLVSSNHQELGMPYVRLICDFIDNGKNFARELGYSGIVMPVMIQPWGISDHPDALYQKSNASMAAIYAINHYNCTKDNEFLKDYLYPFLSELVKFWDDNLTWRENRFVIEESSSRERHTGDLNAGHELAMARLVLKTMIDCEKVIKKSSDEDINRWQNYLDKLSDYPTTCFDGKRLFKEAENRHDIAMGRVGDNPVVLDFIYPAEAERNPRTQLLGRNTLDYLNSWTQSNAFPRIFSQAVRCKYDGEKILQHLKSRFTLGPYPYETLRSNCTIAPDNHSMEAVGAIEAINAMLLLGDGDNIEVFYNWPKERDVEFTSLRTKGAFLVSATQKNGEITYLDIYSEKGELCGLTNPWQGFAVKIIGSDGSNLELSGTTLEWETTAEVSYEISKSNFINEVKTTIEPLAVCATIPVQFQQDDEECQHALDVVFRNLEDTFKLDFTLEMSNGTINKEFDSVEYSYSESGIVEVNKDNLIKPLKAGKTQLTFKVNVNGKILEEKLFIQVVTNRIVRHIEATTQWERYHSWGKYNPKCAVKGDSMTGIDLTDMKLHNPYGLGVFLVKMSEKEEDFLVIDLQREIKIDEMWLWNYNCPDQNHRRLWWMGGSKVGIRDAKILYSCDGENWEVLGGDEKIFRFAKAHGEERPTKATNLDKTNEPVSFDGIVARYVKIQPIAKRYVGNWGGEMFGISRVVFTEI